MHRAGVPMLAGSGAGLGNPHTFAGFSLHDELALLPEAGLPPIEALRAATVNPARFLNLTDSLGSIDRGMVADLVLLDANPLDDIRNTQRIRAVVVDGRLYRRPDLDRLLAQVEALNQATPNR
jgi:imidazolonepropionase-like amidohydrolase